MNTNNKNEGTTLTLAEAVDTLSHIAEIDVEKNIETPEEEVLGFEEDSLAYRTIQWVQHHNAKETMPLVRDIFKVILKYLKSFYASEYSEKKKGQVIQEIKTIMVLVGEAARKLDKLTKLFHKTHEESVTMLKEYCELQDFYRSHISRALDDNVICHWILDMSKKGKSLQDGQKELLLRAKKQGPIDHVFIDLESVKKDTEYELFFMRKEDGTRFFNPHLIRNIKLFSDFGGFFGQERALDPLASPEVVKSRVAYAEAKQLLKATRPILDKFYRNAMKHKDMDVVVYVNEAIMALMLAANPSCLFRDPLIKDCEEYFTDFQKYLRMALHSFDYQRIVVYANNSPSSWSSILLDTIHSLCSSLYMQTNGIGELRGYIQLLIEQARAGVSKEHSNRKGCWDTLAADYSAMTKLIKGHSNGPINIVLDQLERGDVRGFDPLNLGNFPSVEYEVIVGDKKHLIARWPTPTMQESINKVSVCEEFKGFLRDGLADRLYKKCLLVNFQDRLTWKEYYRANALEALNHSKEFSTCIDVVTIAKDTDFYYQQAPYQTCNHTHTFINQFEEQLKEGSGGFLFSEQVEKKGTLAEFCKCGLRQSIGSSFLPKTLFRLSIVLISSRFSIFFSS